MKQSAASDQETVNDAEYLKNAYENGVLGYNATGVGVTGWGTSCLVFAVTLQHSAGH
jgi:hypothetical protein